MKVVLTAAAEDDLDEIRNFIARDSPARAVTFANELMDRCERLADAPEAFQIVPQYERHGVQRRVYKNT